MPPCICLCRRNECECQGECLCCPCICDCHHCRELRRNQNRRGYPIECQAATAAPEQHLLHPCVSYRIWMGPLPNLDFLSNKPSACGSGESSSPTRHVSQTSPERSSPEETIFQMDDLDNSPDRHLESTMHHNISHSSFSPTTSVSQPEELHLCENSSVSSLSSSESSTETHSISNEVFVNGQNRESPSFSALSNVLSTAQAASTSAENPQTGSLSQIENLKLPSPEISKSPTSSASPSLESIGTEQSINESSPTPEKDKKTEGHS